ncbi:hypothetical protein Dfri01_40700 [Dyadobacter frigoris]|uniref:Uncharacterized protein n=2 Tax=Dyadobacter frigoris TaxID=2576211 RepID=A0A4U6CV68_9BACT|nr:hypothetical protein FDK13_26795 [Dyadobacter frigoris]GLU54609.1 hypothetical protein Dfri01_40700 [Dyadobacter frigoris]
MEDSKLHEFVLKISSLWSEQKIREVLYLEALKKDSMGPLRRMLTQGHFSALLFQKEIHWIYDYFKCFLTDKDLVNNEEVNLNTISVLHDLEGKEEVAGYLKKTEGKVLQSYRSLYKYLDRDLETRRVVDEHLDRISEFYEILSKQEIVIIKDLKRPVTA